MIRTRLFVSLCIVLAGVAGCNEGTNPIAAPALSTPDANAAANIFARNTKFVSIGTSVSMGWQSDGVYEATQIVSWPALLEFGNLHPMSLPLILAPGCQSPLIAPLAAGKRLSGESAFGSTVCAPNRPGVTLPTQNVAIAGALAADAVGTTPEAGATARPWYSRVLPSGMTQLTAALAQHPTFVSVELGANEVLGAINGRVVPFVTVVPFPGFQAPYDILLDALGAARPQALLVGLPSDARNFPALRRGDEIWADRLGFSAVNVAVSPDCDGSPNYINVAVKVLQTVFVASQSPVPVPFSCADIPGAEDNVLSPAEIAMVNQTLADETAHIKAQAAARHYAYASLGALYDRPDLKGGAYSVQKQLTSPLPYGVFVSLDGVHPNALGHVVLAAAAARGINERYGFGAALVRSPAVGAALGIR